MNLYYLTNYKINTDIYAQYKYIYAYIYVYICLYIYLICIIELSLY